MADRLGAHFGRGLHVPPVTTGLGITTTAAWEPKIAEQAYDESLSRLFQDARNCMQLTREDLAGRLGTTAHVIATFEAGAISAFPAWPETMRVVEGYAALVGFDPRALLNHIKNLMHSQAPWQTQPQVPAPLPVQVPISAAPPMRTAHPTPVSSARHPSVWRRHWVALAIGAVVFVGAMGFYWAAYSRPAVLMMALRTLPSPIATPIRAAMDGLVVATAPRRDGLRWIDVEDPRTRKADKLPTSNQ